MFWDRLCQILWTGSLSNIKLNFDHLRDTFIYCEWLLHISYTLNSQSQDNRCKMVRENCAIKFIKGMSAKNYNQSIKLMAFKKNNKLTKDNVNTYFLTNRGQPQVWVTLHHLWRSYVFSFRARFSCGCITAFYLQERCDIIYQIIRWKGRWKGKGIKTGSTQFKQIKKIRQEITIGHRGLAYAITFPSLFRTFTTCLGRPASPLRIICNIFDHIQLTVSM